VNHDFLELSASLFQETSTALSATLLVQGMLHNTAGAAVTAAQSGANVLITIDANDTITLNNVTLNALKNSATADIKFA
jgi:hypothetical protein